MSQSNHCNMTSNSQHYVPYPTHIHPPSHIPHGHPYGSPYYCPPPPPIHCGYPYGGGGGYYPMHPPPYPPQVTTLDTMDPQEDPFSAPNEDVCTIESQECDELPIDHCHDDHHQEDHHHHSDHTTVQDNIHRRHHCNDDDDDTISLCSSQTSMTSCTGSTYYTNTSCYTQHTQHPQHPQNQPQQHPQSQPQQDTFILRVPKNKKCRLNMNGTDHGHIGPHVHVNAYGQVLPTHPHLH